MVRDKSPVMLILGLMVAITATVTFGLVNIEVLNETIAPYSNWVFVGGFGGVYLLSDRELNRLEDFEAVAFLVPLLVAGGMQYIPELQGFVSDYNPLAGFVLVGIALMGFYALSTDLSFGFVAVEMLLGGILAVTAGVQFGVVEIEILNNHINTISVWVFVVTLLLAYMVSERDIGNMSQLEVGAIVVGVGSYLAYDFVPEVQSFVMASTSRGAVFTLIVVVAYYIIMENGDIPVVN